MENSALVLRFNTICIILLGVNKTPDSPNGKEFGGVADTESYEKAAPAHGDVLFHTFLMKIQENPGQILR